MLDNKLAVSNLLTGLQPSLAQSHPGLQLVIIYTIIPEEKEKVFFVALALLAFDIPIVLPGHLVFILLLFFVIYVLSEIITSLFQCLVSGQEVSDELFSGLVHDSTNHGLGHHLHLAQHRHSTRCRISVEDYLSTRIFPHF